MIDPPAKRRLLAEVMIAAGRHPDERYIANAPEHVIDNALQYYTASIHVG